MLSAISFSFRRSLSNDGVSLEVCFSRGGFSFEIWFRFLAGSRSVCGSGLKEGRNRLRAISCSKRPATKSHHYFYFFSTQRSSKWPAMLPSSLCCALLLLYRITTSLKTYSLRSSKLPAMLLDYRALYCCRLALKVIALNLYQTHLAQFFHFQVGG